MTIYTNATQPLVQGQQVSPAFGVFSGGAIPASMNPIVNPVPLAATVGGSNLTLLEACARGSMPRNAQLATISGVSVSAGISASQGDSMSVDDGMSGGNGAEVCLGAACSPNGGNPGSITTMGIDNQVFVSGATNLNDALSTGPVLTDNESVISAPTPGSTTVANITLVPGAYQG